MILYDDNGDVLRSVISSDTSDLVSVAREQGRAILTDAFKADRTTEKVLLPYITRIEESAFESCSKLVSVNINCKINEVDHYREDKLVIQHYAFKDCSELSDVVISDYETVIIESGAFDGCTNLRTLVLNEVKNVEIRSDAFGSVNKDIFRIYYQKDNSGYIKTVAREDNIICKQFKELK